MEFFIDEINLRITIEVMQRQLDKNKFFYWNYWIDLNKVPEEMKNLTNLINSDYKITPPYRTDINKILTDFFNHLLINDGHLHEIVILKESEQKFIIFNTQLKQYTKIEINKKFISTVISPDTKRNFYENIRGKDFKIKNKHINFIIDYLKFEYEDFDTMKLNYIL